MRSLMWQSFRPPLPATVLSSLDGQPDARRFSD
jgi:hypothetical protein